MKQPQQHSTAQTTATPIALSRRRLMGQVVLGGAAALVLSACGGGGSDSTDNSRDLEAAYYRLKDGMTWDEAVAAVGWPPNRDETSWYDSGFKLNLIRRTKVGSDVWYLDTASLLRPDNSILNRNFEYGQ